MTNTGTDRIRRDLSAVDRIVERVGGTPEKVIPVLQAIQQQFRYLPQEALRRVCEISEITPASIHGVATFYTQFRHKPVGEHIVHICNGTACHVKGSEQVYQSFMRELRIPNGEDTDENLSFTVQKVSCLGCCTLAPVVQIDDITYGHVKPDRVSRILEDFLLLDSHHSDQKKNVIKPGADGATGEIRLGLGSCCVASGSGDVQQALEQTIEETGVRVRVKRVGCVGMCHQTPLLEVAFPNQQTVLYAKVQPEHVSDIVLRHFKPMDLKTRLRTKATRYLEQLLTDEKWEPVTRYAIDVREQPVADFLSRQQHIATEHSGVIDPSDIEEYLQREGFDALRRCLLELSPTEIINHVLQSGLRGRGGGGFLTGKKWQLTADAKGAEKYLVCNGDEGDPGAFMDRMLLESYPFRIIEGMIIAARAVGAQHGYLYIRAEYPLAVKRVQEALKICREYGFLGKNILGSDFVFDLSIMEGAGAFVCGEETALIQSMEGKRGMPYYRPPYPSEKGIWGKPTLVNNTETFSLIPWILRHSPDEFSALGTDNSAGTKVFALAGKVARGGLIEVPMGITIEQIVEEIGGGTVNGKKFKAVQIGGPSGGCIPAELGHTPVDFKALNEAGAMMGSGGLLVLDETDCMVDIARYFLSFTQDQSCGKCTFCRIGTRRMLDILSHLTTGSGTLDELAELERLAHKVKQGSLCGLGRTAPNPVLTTLRYFRDEYLAHLEGRCPAKKCTDLIHYSITDDCIGCTICAQRCPVDAITLVPYQQHEIDQQKCTKCDICRQACPADAVRVD